MGNLGKGAKLLYPQGVRPEGRKNLQLINVFLYIKQIN